MTKGCYTCRRRRIICDNGQPTCRKCRDAGKECLGYQKPLVWVKGGVASRGKMMGRSFDDTKQAGDKKRQTSSPAHSSTAPGAASLGFFPRVESSSDTESPSSGAQESPEVNAWPHESSTIGVFESAEEDTEIGSSSSEEVGMTLDLVPRSTRTERIPAPWGLVDPLLKDLNQTSRFYLSHCMIIPLILTARHPTDHAWSRLPVYDK